MKPNCSGSSVFDFTGGAATPANSNKRNLSLGEASLSITGRAQTSKSCTGDPAADALPLSLDARLTGGLANSSETGRCAASACNQQLNNICPLEELVQTTRPGLISLERLQLLDEVGHGSFGKVYKCMWLGRLLAVKIKASDGAVDPEIEILRMLADGPG